MINNKSSAIKPALIFIISLAVIMALGAIVYLAIFKKPSPIAVQPTATPTATPISTTSVDTSGNFKIAYSLVDGIYIANSDGASAQKVFDCPIYEASS